MQAMKQGGSHPTMVASTHLRAVIETMLRDKIDPAISDLLALTEHPEEG